MAHLNGLVKAGKSIGLFLKKNSPGLLSGLAIAGGLSTAALTGVATVKAYSKIADYELECEPNSKEWNEYLDHPWRQRVKLTWKYYIPPIIMGSISTACVIGSNKASSKQTAALASAYSIAENTIKEYQEKIIENFDKKGLDKIREDIDEKHLEENPLKETIIIDNPGDIVVYDTVSGRYFKSDMETLRRIQNDINKDVLDSMWVSLNDFYYVLGLDEVKIGEDLGWTPDKLMDICFDSKLSEKGEPVMVIDYEVSPFNYL